MAEIDEPGSDALLPPGVLAGMADPVPEAAPVMWTPPDAPKRPDVTPAQYIAFVPLLVEFGHAFGIFSLSAPQQESLTKLVTAGIALFGADAIIRLGRNLAQRL